MSRSDEKRGFAIKKTRRRRCWAQQQGDYVSRAAEARLEASGRVRDGMAEGRWVVASGWWPSQSSLRLGVQVAPGVGRTTFVRERAGCLAMPK